MEKTGTDEETGTESESGKRTVEAPISPRDGGKGYKWRWMVVNAGSVPTQVVVSGSVMVMSCLTASSLNKDALVAPRESGVAGVPGR
jgi:hypothetical protein